MRSGRILRNGRNEEMKIAAMSPTVTAFRDDRARNVNSAWRMVDFRQDDGRPTRVVYHYGTLMGFFYGSHPRTPLWEFEPVSTGWGSVSDQGGMNKILAGMGWVYRRDAKGGGARYERTVS
jgi:hypothetical protein